MRLAKIKLSGFKSFVDPTTLLLPSNLIGVVGPNGCGKSNIIDAVRWVLGESSAKMLRGASMSDVIFSGSSSRKPVGTAQVELVFDNSDGAISGEYARYNEISVKRMVSRDGQSVYFLNGSRCRRRDITDLFLGTGLGPRSYSIIEQGMISRIVEARPEDLRAYLEEAAGISRYKERRRETENRMRHTRENLERLLDLREELDKRLAQLQRQARAAERYKQYKEELRLRVAQRAARAWQAATNKQHTETQQQREAEIALEAATATLRKQENLLEKLRAEQLKRHDELNGVQNERYQIMAELSRLEQEEAHLNQQHQRLTQDSRNLEQKLEALARHTQEDEQRLSQSRQWLQQHEPELQALEEQWQQRQEARQQVAARNQQLLADWEARQQAQSQLLRQAEGQRATIAQLEAQQQRLQQKQQADAQALQQLRDQPPENPLPQLESELEALMQQDEQLQQLAEQAAEQGQAAREQSTEMRRQLHEKQQKLQQLAGRKASLEALQQQARSAGLQQWLAERGLEDCPTLAQALDVEPRWQQAVEQVLAPWLALPVVSSDVLAELQKNESLPPRLSVLLQPASRGEGGLNAVVRAPAFLHAWLASIQPVENRQQAAEKLPALQPGESCISPDGWWAGPDFIREPGQAEDSQLLRARQLEQVTEDMRQLQAEVTQLEQQTEALSAQARQHEQQFQECRQQAGPLRQRMQQLQQRIRHESRQQQDWQQKIHNLEQRLRQYEEERTELEARLQPARAELTEWLEQLEAQEQSLETLRSQRDQAAAELEQLTRESDEARMQLQSRLLEMEKHRTTVEGLENGLKRMRRDFIEQSDQLSAMREELAALDAPRAQLQQARETALELRNAVEEKLTAARKWVEEAEQKLQQAEKERLQQEQALAQARDRLEQARLQLQSTRMQVENLHQSITATGFSLEEVLESLTDALSQDQLDEDIEALEARIRRLEPVNLAAIEEYQQEAERKQWMDAQHDDLQQALATLEKAIHKIDRETRTLFKDTYDQVNQGMQALFPKLFGGGHAYLELTDDNLLETGVTIMARPPGKRVSNIHLLSGGEKALTAVAFVFAIFNLNPAPFCMLDEVDAPLDDANVGRFSQLVKEMSEQVQFVFVTHNKVTMEIAQQLSGVTMREPGVSRLVQVDLEEATQMVDG